MEIKIISYSQGPFEYDRELYLSNLKGEFNLMASTTIHYSDNRPFFGFQIDLAIFIGEKRTLMAGLMIGMAVDDRSDAYATMTDFLSDDDNKVRISTTAWSVATGIIAARTAGDNAQALILPTLSPEEIIKGLKLSLENPSEAK